MTFIHTIPCPIYRSLFHPTLLFQAFRQSGHVMTSFWGVLAVFLFNCFFHFWNHQFVFFAILFTTFPHPSVVIIYSYYPLSIDIFLRASEQHNKQPQDEYPWKWPLPLPSNHRPFVSTSTGTWLKRRDIQKDMWDTWAKADDTQPKKGASETTI